MRRTIWFVVIGGVAMAGLGCSDAAEETCVEGGGLFRLSPAPLEAPSEFLREVCFRDLDAVNGCPVYSFRVLSAEEDTIDNGFAQFIDISHSDDPSKCSGGFVAGLILGGRWFILEATSTDLTEDGSFVAEGAYGYASDANGAFTFVLHPDLSSRLR